MEILLNKENVLVPFSDINAGECFRNRTSNSFMVLDEQYEDHRGTQINSVNLISGELSFFRPMTDVAPLNAVLHCSMKTKE